MKNTTGIISTEHSLASELRIIERAMVDLEKDKEVVRAALLNELQRQGIKSVRLDDGTSYTRAERANLIVTEPTKALAFAKRHFALKIDTAKILKLIRPMLKQPTFFSIGRTEYLRVTRKNETNGEADDVE